MAKKSSKTPMAVNKSNTPAWMKTVIIVLVITFGVGGVAIAAAGAGLFGGGTTSGTTATSGGTINDQYKPRVDAAVAALSASPDNPDIIVQVGHAYFDWARAVYESGQPEASVPTWLAAVSYYDQTLAIRPDDDIALGNKAFALFYASDDRAADALRAFIDAAGDNAGLAAQVENARALLAELEAAPASPIGSTPATTTP
ncbi:MAG: hypothetical protein JW733_05475 [Coriobacteriia bacterium]|nr:hypothetical protein [Coriobacteriia bacterium]MBN2839954.1 hypothetical protein [Coriobacteriia bacterium]